MKKIYHIFLLISMACGHPESKKDMSDVQEQSTNTIKISKDQFKNSKLEMGTFSEQNFPVTVQVNGMLDVPPQNRASVSSFLGGYIFKIPLLIGHSVKKGQFLASLENPEFITLQQQYVEAAEKLVYLKAEYDRQKILIAENITSQKSFLKAESDYKTTLASYNGLKKKLEMLNIDPAEAVKGNISGIVNIYSPINGAITKINVASGTYVSPSDEIMEIINTDHLHLELNVFEKDLLKIKKGQTILYHVSEAFDEVFSGEVSLIGTSIDEQTRTVKVHGHINEKDDSSLAVGMFVEAGIVVASTQKLAIPATAVVELNGNNFYMALSEETASDYIFEKRLFKVKIKNENFIAPEGTVSEKDKILIKGAYSLLSE